MSSMTSRLQRRLDMDKNIPRKISVSFLMSPSKHNIWRGRRTRDKCNECGSTARRRCFRCRPCELITHARRSLKKEFRARLAKLNAEHAVKAVS